MKIRTKFNAFTARSKVSDISMEFKTSVVNFVICAFEVEVKVSMHLYRSKQASKQAWYPTSEMPKHLKPIQPTYTCTLNFAWEVLSDNTRELQKALHSFNFDFGSFVCRNLKVDLCLCLLQMATSLWHPLSVQPQPLLPVLDLQTTRRAHLCKANERRGTRNYGPQQA